MADERLIEIFLALAKLDGVSGHEKPVADYILAFLKGLGLSSLVDDAASVTGSDTGNVVCRVGGGGDRVLLAHMDTARPTKDTKAVVSSDRISSDGKSQLGADNRAGIAVILFATEKAVREKLPVKPFTLAFTTQEETSMGGSINLKLEPSVTQGFIFDSSLDPGSFAVTSPGAASFKAEVFGKPSHAGIAPEKGVCAITIAAKALAGLRFGRLDPETTANVGKIHGGEATNVVPAHAVVEGEARSLDMDKVAPIVEGIRRGFEDSARRSGGQLKFSWVWEFKPFRIADGAPVFQEALRAVRKAGLTPSPMASHGGSDANNLNARGVAAVNFGIGARNPHADDEYILLEHLQKAADIALSLMRA
ncbi:MAG: M20/M25/M40 family metallo-hydrolase [Elusimicrobiota bacterium]